MSIISMWFPLLVVAATLVYYRIPHRFRWVWLLALSYGFYLTFDLRYTLFLLFSTLSTYLSGRLITCLRTAAHKKLWVSLTCIINLGILVVFKYIGFLNVIITSLTAAFGVHQSTTAFSLILPVGISFYTFQSLTYTIDVYRGDVKPERNFAKYALFVSFFPTLLCGPIQKSKKMLKRFDEVHEFDYDRLRRGGLLALYGYFQKMVVADRLGILVSTVFSNPAKYHGAESVVASLFYTLQIYFDFAGYSNIALGVAEMLGFDLDRNFDRPYFSESVREFWRRWHISLSTWFRDYLYIPLGGNRCSVPKQALNIVIVSSVCGLWHGSSLSFLVWGLLHGIYQVLGKFTKRYRYGFLSRMGVDAGSGRFRVPRIAFTFILVSFAWIFFRAATLNDAFILIGGMFRFDPAALWNGSLLKLGLSQAEWCEVCIGVLLIWFVDLKSRKTDLRAWVLNRSTPCRWSLYVAAVLVILTLGVYGQASSTEQFIYAKF